MFRNRACTRRTALVICMAMATSSPLAAVELPLPSTARAEVDRYIATQMQRLRIPGMSVAVVRGRRIVLLRHYGRASIEFDRPVDDRTVFAINSVTKAFTGIAAMRLVQQGRLDLAAAVGSYLPGLPKVWRGVTIRQLLSHMSGLPDIMRAPTVDTDAAAAWSWVQAQPVLFAPGARFHYCQTNYTLVQRVINTIRDGTPDAPLTDDQIRIAGMTDTSFGDVQSVISNKAPTYRWNQTGPMITGYRAAASTAPDTLAATAERFLPFRRASSGLNSSARDMARWIIALKTHALLDAPGLQTLWTPVPFDDGQPGQWALGWQVLARGSHRAVGMTGGGRAAVFIYPEDDIGIVILTNLAGAFPEDMVDKIASLYAPELDLTGVPALRIALEEQGYAKASTIAAAMQARHPALRWPEAELNDWGYRLLSTGRARDALPLFQFITRHFPHSANAHDSLAQASLVNGDAAAALLHYERALALDPANDSARRHVDELRGGGGMAGVPPR